jgi:hypothetical protein
MSHVWYCVNCGYEVDTGGRCHACGELLAASPLPELTEGELADDDEVGYRLSGWDDRQRGRLIKELVDRRIRHRFERDELVTSVTNEATVDRLVDRLQSPAASQNPHEYQRAPDVVRRRRVRHDPRRDLAGLLAVGVIVFFIYTRTDSVRLRCLAQRAAETHMSFPENIVCGVAGE